MAPVRANFFMLLVVRNGNLFLNPIRPTQPTRGVDRSGLEWVGVGWSGLEWVGVGGVVGVGRRISMMHGNEVLPLNHLPTPTHATHAN